MIAALDPRLALVPMRTLLAWLAEDVQQPALPSPVASRSSAPQPPNAALPQRWNLSGDWTMPRREGVLRRPGFTVSSTLSNYAAKRWDFSQPDAPPPTDAVEPPFERAQPPGPTDSNDEIYAAALPTMATPVSRLPPRPEPGLPPPRPRAAYEAPAAATPAVLPRPAIMPHPQPAETRLATPPPLRMHTGQTPRTELLTRLDGWANRSFLMGALGLVVLAGLAAVLLH